MGFLAAPYKVAEMAMQIEQKGVEFYAHLAERNKDESTKKVFLALARQEKAHCEIFETIVNETKTICPEQEYSIDVLKIFQETINNIKESAFSFKGLDTRSIEMMESLEMAIHAEREAIRIYTEIYKSFTEKFSTVVLKIIEEERKHLNILLTIQASITEGN